VTTARRPDVTGAAHPSGDQLLSRRRFLAGAGAAAGAGLVAASPLRPMLARAAASRTRLDAYILGKMAEGAIPALSAALIDGDHVVWTGAYGTANLEHGVAATPDTIFMLASVSKTVTAVAVLQAVEDGLLDLDADVNDVLPFPVRNPNAPDIPITPRMLLTHTSSIVDNVRLFAELYFRGDSPIALGDFLADYLVPGGAYYDPAANFGGYPPLRAVNYCNYAVALAGYLVEVVEGVPFDRFCHARIFEPLGMVDTSWHLAGLPDRSIAMPYTLHGGEFQPAGLYGYPDYPDGQLRTSAPHLARHLMAFMGFGELDGTRILQAATVEEMRRVQYPNLDPTQGLIWYYAGDLHGNTVLGHNGGDIGVSTEMFFDPEANLGVIMLTTLDVVEAYQLRAYYHVMARLWTEIRPGVPPPRLGAARRPSRRPGPS
jgi:CubicO group peptidase (beta-lactamase class C family)